jgi:thioredoxin-like negative regulator of GroEL
MLAPRLERLAEKNPSLCIVKVDCDRSDELTSGFSIQTVPTIAMFYAGNQIGMLRGGSLEQIKQTIESLTPVRVDIMNC